MRLDKYITQNGTDYDVISDDVILDLHAAGRGTFKINTAKNAIDTSKAITFSQGYLPDAAQVFFIGYINRVVSTKAEWSVIECKELSHSLLQDCPISLINCTVGDILADISATTKLTFECPISSQKTERFQSKGSALNAVKNIGRVFNVTGFICQQQADGKIYIGPKSDKWQNQQIDIDPQFFASQTDTAATIGAIPQIKPGWTINGKQVTRIRQKGTQMHITWG